MLRGSTRSAKLVFEALVDVGIIVIAHFRNPARRYAAQLLLDALILKSYTPIPVNTEHDKITKNQKRPRG